LPGSFTKKSCCCNALGVSGETELPCPSLNYPWDETIFELRKRIVRYDLEYFFDLAVTNLDKRKKLRAEEDPDPS
jgi:hypothetical protein